MNIRRFATLVLSLAFLSPVVSLADVVSDWNDKACKIVGSVGPGAPGHRLMAIVEVAVFEAATSIQPKYAPYMQRVAAPAGASIDAAVAAANRAALLELVPAEKAAIETAYQAAMASIPDGQAKADGAAVGEKAAALVVARAGKDGSVGPDNYQWHTTAGIYVPTMVPAAATWARRTPWGLEKASQFRPGPPPKLDSETWGKDFQEVKGLGARNSTARTPEQTDIARFWEETRPLIYYPLLRPIANLPGRSVVQNARLYAAAGIAMDESMIAIFVAQYHYNILRPSI